MEQWWYKVNSETPGSISLFICTPLIPPSIAAIDTGKPSPLAVLIFFSRAPSTASGPSPASLLHKFHQPNQRFGVSLIPPGGRRGRLRWGQSQNRPLIYQEATRQSFLYLLVYLKHLLYFDDILCIAFGLTRENKILAFHN